MLNKLHNFSLTLFPCLQNEDDAHNDNKMKPCLQHIAQCLVHKKCSVILGILTVFRQELDNRGSCRPNKSCGLYPSSNWNPLRGFEQDVDMIHGVFRRLLWEQCVE